MIIASYFTDKGVPKEGLLPTIRVRYAGTGVLVVTDALMTEKGDGWYTFDFVGHDVNFDYIVRCDGGVTQRTVERYTWATIGIGLSVELSDPSKDFIKDLMYNKEVIERHENCKPKRYTVGTGGNQFTVATEIECTGNVKKEIIE